MAGASSWRASRGRGPASPCCGPPRRPPSRSDMPAEGRILVVDDHVEMGRMLREPLTDEGYTVDLATGGEEAVRLVRSRLYDAVLSDLRMEKVDSLDVLEAVHAVDSEVPVLLMTAFGGVESAVEAMKRGAYHYFTKPFRLDEVLVFLKR